MNVSTDIRDIVKLLNRAYGKPPARPKSDPADELIRTVLSQNTSDKNSIPAFNALKARFGSWEKAAYAPIALIANTIRHAGLANIKAGRIRQILSEIRDRERRWVVGSLGRWVEKKKIDLSRLGHMAASDAMEYLTSLKGVGLKTASCVLLFSFRKPVMPVDTHIFRITKRLGLIARKLDIGQAHKELTSIVPKRLIYNFHLSIIEHGRRTCRARNPRCGSCVLYGMCKWGHKTEFNDQ